KLDWPRLCRAIDRVDLIDDQRFSTAEARFENTEAVVALIDAAIATKDMSEWRSLFDEHGIIWGAIPKIDRVAADPQMKANTVFAELAHPQLGATTTINNPINVSGVTKEKPRLAPEVGQHSIEVLKDLGYEQQQIDDLIRREIVSSPS